MIVCIPRDSYQMCKCVKLTLKRMCVYIRCTSIDIHPCEYCLCEIWSINKELPEEQPLKIGNVKGR